MHELTFAAFSSFCLAVSVFVVSNIGANMVEHRRKVWARPSDKRPQLFARQRSDDAVALEVAVVVAFLNEVVSVVEDEARVLLVNTDRGNETIAISPHRSSSLQEAAMRLGSNEREDVVVSINSRPVG